ncbi:MAG TPA: 8-amino-7-oxononanoate synthase [Candidatus Omnitrophota bacterium]|nr:8-amino-7-oxononanoate synthase [Candidatus Omnitrophota bacterium]
MEEIRDFLKKRDEEGSLRILRPSLSRGAGRIKIGSKEYFDLSSNDYLGISDHSALKSASIKAIEQYGTGSSASRLLSGDSALYHELEEKVARFKGKPSALVFNSGYQGNVGILSALCNDHDAIFADKLSHASILDGIFLSEAKLFRFKHNDLEHLESLLRENRKDYKNCLIITETIFSMDGDRAPLRELVGLKNKYDCSLMVDEAHATGIFGKNGAGIVEEEGLSEDVDLIMGTFSKALGSFGAYLAGSKDLIDYLVNTCRSFIYSTALPPAVIAANIAALDIVEKEPWRRENLLKLSDYFRTGLKDAGFNPLGSSQIVPVVLGDNFKVLDSSRKLSEKGWWVLAVRPPTVAKGQSRLRFSLSASHDEKILGNLLNDIRSLGI